MDANTRFEEGVCDSGGPKMIGASVRFGIVRLMFMIQSSGVRGTDRESDSRAMLYVGRAVCRGSR
ncbi:MULTISPECIES: hypothetical protein [Mycobacterium]|uniref:hypothetical protein n=1 Tax=Mycobacterium TaxID=1763 RepID=UPI001CDA2097|nr:MULTISPECIES: hypothetical protein [Mycobacterium]MCA2244227.1 hypothetical protein [Mycobacterium sp. WUMAC-067]MCA2314952.1 hypothetical protein [Mycobacterium sp. WUMAC-025]MEE3752877.1 hypothetical protein [Mycobacterium intracellulare]